MASVQAALPAKPELVLGLLGFGLSAASGSFKTLLDIRTGRPTNTPGIEDGLEHEQRLDHGVDPTDDWKDGTRFDDPMKAFAAYRETGKHLSADA